VTDTILQMMAGLIRILELAYSVIRAWRMDDMPYPA
jgi:hypothetical protein